MQHTPLVDASSAQIRSSDHWNRQRKIETAMMTTFTSSSYYEPQPTV
jgi:hypothetical protein